jgi:hypothetical protein
MRFDEARRSRHYLHDAVGDRVELIARRRAAVDGNANRRLPVNGEARWLNGL